MFKKFVALMLALSLSVGPSLAGELRAELQFLRDTHPLIRASQFAADASELRRQAAVAGFLPKVTVSGDGGSEEITTTSTTGGSQATDLNRQKWVYTVEQNIFNGGKTFAEVGIASVDQTLKQSEARANGQDVLLEAVIAYLQVLRNQLLIRLSEINEQTTRQQLDMEKARVERGGGVVVDELQAATRLQIVRERRVFYEQAMRDATATYEQVYGHPPQQEKIQDLDNYLGLIPQDIDVALKQGKDHNPRLIQVRLQIERAQQSIGLERSNFMPKIDFVLSQTRDKDVAGVSRKDEDSALIKFSWNIFSGGDSINRTRAAALDRQEAMEREVSTQRKIDESIRMSWNQYQKGIERLKLLEEAAESSRKVMDGRKKLRDAGRETVLAVLDAEVEHFGVLANKVNAMIDARLGSYRLLHATGLLDIAALDLDSDNFRLPVRPVDDTLEQLLGWKMPRPGSQKPALLAQSLPAQTADNVGVATPQAVTADALKPEPAQANTAVALTAEPAAIPEIEAARTTVAAEEPGPQAPAVEVAQAVEPQAAPEGTASTEQPEPQAPAMEVAQAVEPQVAPEGTASAEQPEPQAPTVEVAQAVEPQAAPEVAVALLPPEMAAPIELASHSDTVPVEESVVKAMEPPMTDTPTPSESVTEEAGGSARAPDPQVVLSEKVLEWAQTWSSRDFESYAEFYSDDFETRKFSSKDEWLDYRRPRILGKTSIQVEIQNLVIRLLDSGLAEARFEQNYRAGDLKVRSVKKLKLGKEGDSWRILWEGN